MSADSTAKALIPEWLDSEFLEGILRNYYKTNEINVINVAVKSTAANGESFMSSMYRAKVIYSATHNQVIIHFLKCNNFFKTKDFRLPAKVGLLVLLYYMHRYRYRICTM